MHWFLYSSPVVPHRRAPSAAASAPHRWAISSIPSPSAAVGEDCHALLVLIITPRRACLARFIHKYELRRACQLQWPLVHDRPEDIRPPMVHRTRELGPRDFSIEKIIQFPIKSCEFYTEAPILLTNSSLAPMFIL
jgi:hypothetical protein